MAPGRLHITGASGAGVTTLGRALAQVFAVPQFDADDVYWMPTADPFTQKRPVEERVALLQDLIGARDNYILSGSVTGWGDQIAAGFTTSVFVRTDQALRLKRLRDREVMRFGTAVTSEDGARYDCTQGFLRWAAQYEDPEFTGRSLVRHRAWLSRLGCRVIEVDGGRPVDALLEQVVSTLKPDPAGDGTTVMDSVA